MDSGLVDRERPSLRKVQVFSVRRVMGTSGTADHVPLKNDYSLLLLSTTDGYKVRIAEAQRGSTSSIPDNVMFPFGPRGDITNLSLSLFLSD